ncbi:ABC transporter permease subunit [Morganella morganii]|uniref:ABC transporter permease subunit n=1 Tax=Morganella morganii TaxID=582 RepID=UPI001FFD60BD|nr:ABC transporter permease subunit [Morganella morganii]
MMRFISAGAAADPMLLGTSLFLSDPAPGPSDPALDYLRLSKIPPTPQAVESARELLGLDKPIMTQYFHWLSDALHLDFGISYATQKPVLPDLLYFLPATLQLAGCTGADYYSVCAMGMLAARYREKWPDQLVRVIAFIGVSMPNFWLGFLLILLFSIHLGWLPPMGKGKQNT